jgi:hypothetical protein
MLKHKLLKLIWPFYFQLRIKLLPFKIKKAEIALSKKYKAKYSKRIIKKEIVLMIDDNYAKGGFMDKVKGIISGKYIADSLDLEFYVYIKNGNFPIYKFLSTKNNLFRLSDEEIYFDSASKPVILYNYIPSKKTILKKFTSKKQYHLYCNMNVIPTLNIEKSELEQTNIWTTYFNKLFTFNDNILALDQLVHLPSIQKIAIHLRFLNALGDFNDIRNNELQKEDKEKLIQICLHAIKKTIYKNKDCKKILIFSDSALFLNLVKDHFLGTNLEETIFINSDNIKHSALNSDDKAFEKTILDFYQMSSCHKIFQIHYFKMHNSDFSKYASFVNQSTYQFIEASND